LRESNQPLFESENDIYLIKGKFVFRYVKPDSKPRIMRVESLQLNPDHYSAKIELSLKDLTAFANRERLCLFETEDGFYLPGECVIYASKQKVSE